jgi:hypothetical protein
MYGKYNANCDDGQRDVKRETSSDESQVSTNRRPWTSGVTCSSRKLCEDPYRPASPVSQECWETAIEAFGLVCVVLAHGHQIVSRMPVVCSIGAHGHYLRDDLRFWAQYRYHSASLSDRARWYGSGRGPSSDHA